MPRPELRVAQIAAASSRSPWFTNICSEVARRGFEVVAIIAGPRHLEAAVTRMAERLTWRADDLIVSGSEYAACLYRRLGVPDERIACVYYGSPAESFDPATVDRQAFRRELGISPDAP